MERTGHEARGNHVIDPNALSAARVVHRYYGGRARFPRISDEMMAAVDKADAAQFSAQEVLAPEGWVLLSFLMDPRTGLGRFRQFRISNYELMMKLIDFCRDHSVERAVTITCTRRPSILPTACEPTSRSETFSAAQQKNCPFWTLCRIDCILSADVRSCAHSNAAQCLLLLVWVRISAIGGVPS
jgi:hypothetical protein